MSHNITPKSFAIKYKPPILALIYEKEKVEFIHEFNLTEQLLKEKADIIFSKLSISNPGYLDLVDSIQVKKLIQKL
jgi:hypothetical protein